METILVKNISRNQLGCQRSTAFLPYWLCKDYFYMSYLCFEKELC